MGGQPSEVGQLAGAQVGGELIGEFGLAAALVRHRKEIDHEPASSPVRQSFAQAIENSAVAIAREQSITVDEIEQRHWLAPQGMDHVPIDDLVVLAVWMRPPTRQGEEMGAANERVETIVEGHAQLVADQT